jgi:hypothetical protein
MGDAWTETATVNEMPLRAPNDPNDKLSTINHDHHASILPLCTGLARRISSFLNTEPSTPLLRSVQEQTRIALGVIDTALERYRYPLSSAPSRTLPVPPSVTPS